MEYYTTSDGLHLLQDWGGHYYPEKEYTKNTRIAKNAARKLFLSGALVFECGEKPRTAAEFFEGMPYTSTGIFAAIWAGCNWQISNRGQKNLYLDGIAITDEGKAVAIWKEYNEHGEETGEKHQII